VLKELIKHLGQLNLETSKLETSKLETLRTNIPGHSLALLSGSLDALLLGHQAATFEWNVGTTRLFGTNFLGNVFAGLVRLLEAMFLGHEGATFLGYLGAFLGKSHGRRSHDDGSNNRSGVNHGSRLVILSLLVQLGQLLVELLGELLAQAALPTSFNGGWHLPALLDVVGLADTFFLLLADPLGLIVADAVAHGAALTFSSAMTFGCGLKDGIYILS
jgi:hypothetical protein